MVLVLGAFGAGKRAYARSLGYNEDQISSELSSAAPVLDSLEELVRRDPDHAAELFPALCKKELVLCCEVGSGVIPISKEERTYREQTGRLCVTLAKEASAVVRIVAGIPAAIKGELPCT